METIHLQGIGEAKAKRAGDLKPGDKLLYNGSWTEYEVLQVKQTGKSVVISERNTKTGQVFSRTRRAHTLVGISNA